MLIIVYLYVISSAFSITETWALCNYNCSENDWWCL